MFVLPVWFWKSKTVYSWNVVSDLTYFIHLWRRSPGSSFFHGKKHEHYFFFKVTETYLERGIYSTSMDAHTGSFSVHSGISLIRAMRAPFLCLVRLQSAHYSQLISQTLLQIIKLYRGLQQVSSRSYPQFYLEPSQLGMPSHRET